MSCARHISGGLAVAFACFGAGRPLLAQTGADKVSGVNLASQTEGRPIEQVDVVLSRSSGDICGIDAFVAHLIPHAENQTCYSRKRHDTD
jgi:hypothetical protein